MFNNSALFDLKPAHVSFDGDPSNPVWAAIFVASTNGIPVTRNGLYHGSVTDTSSLEYWLQYAETSNLIPSTLSIYGTAASPAYALVLEPNSGVQWAVGNEPNGYDDNQSVADYQAFWNAQVPAGNRVGIVDLNGDNQYVAMYRDDYVGPVVGYHGLSRTDMDAAFATQTKAGFFPISIQGGGVDGTTEHFAALFAQSDLPLGKVMTAAGSTLKTDTPIASIDTAVTSFMSAHDVRQASLSVLDGKKLVYARGYNLEEPGLGEVTATSTFRLASVSKVVTAMEIMHLVDRGQLKGTDTVQSILNLKTYTGAAPAAGFATITIANLLQHSFPTLGTNPTTKQANCLLRDVDVSQTAASTLGVSLPLTRAQAISVALANPSLVTGPDDEGCYSNFGYMLLGQVVEAKRGLPLLSAMQTDLFAPLSITHALVSSPSVTAQPAGEALYRPIDLLAVGNVNIAGSPIAEVSYGGDNFNVSEAAGGLSIASTDVARLLASLNVSTSNPIYTKSTTVSEILTNGFGYDQAITDSAGNVHHVKGGEIAGLQSTVNFVQNGISYVLIWAHDGLDGFTGADNWWPTWTTLDTALNGASLGSRPDLFPQYGMSSL